MKLISLDLINFRNYESLHLELDPGVNLIVGNNAQGKTNLLESVVYLSQSASYRTRKEEELIRWNQDFARLEAKIQGQDRETELVYALFRGSRRRQIMKNGVRQKSAAGTEGILTTVLFCPSVSCGHNIKKPFPTTKSSMKAKAGFYGIGSKSPVYWMPCRTLTGKWP